MGVDFAGQDVCDAVAGFLAGEPGLQEAGDGVEPGHGDCDAGRVDYDGVFGVGGRDGRDEAVLTAVFGQVEGRLVLAFGLPGCGVAGEDEGVVGFLGQVNGFSEEVFVVL